MNTKATGTAGAAPRDAIAQQILAVDPAADRATVGNAVAAVVNTVVRQRQVVRALAEVLRDGRPPAPQVLGELMLLLRRTRSAAVAAPACRGCARPLSSVQPTVAACPNCRLIAIVQPLLTVGDQVRPELVPLLVWWRGVDRPGSVRSWLARRPAAKVLLRDLAASAVELSHEGLDQIPDTKTVRYVRRILVAAGVLPAHDEHLRRLEQWMNRTVAAIADPDQRTIVHRYAVWYHLRRLRARTGPQKPVTDGQAAPIRNHVRVAAAVLATLAEAGHTLADLRQTDIDEWLAGRRVARRAELGLFLRWARRERLTAVAIPVQQWAGPDGRIDHDQRWTLARRLLHDDAVPTEDRLAGLLVVLYAQTAARIRLLRFDHLDSGSGGVRITFGTTPIDLPPAVADLFARLVAERAGTDRAATPWLSPAVLGTSRSARTCCANASLRWACPPTPHAPPPCSNSPSTYPRVCSPAAWALTSAAPWTGNARPLGTGTPTPPGPP